MRFKAHAMAVHGKELRPKITTRTSKAEPPPESAKVVPKIFLKWFYSFLPNPLP
jgi:hypothetical protein